MLENFFDKITPMNYFIPHFYPVPEGGKCGPQDGECADGLTCKIDTDKVDGICQTGKKIWYWWSKLVCHSYFDLGELKHGDLCSTDDGICADGLICKVPPYTSCPGKEECEKKCLLQVKSKFFCTNYFPYEGFVSPLITYIFL